MLSHSQNCYSKDYLEYGRDPGGLLLVVLVLHRCVNTMEARMEMVHSIKEGLRDVDTSVGIYNIQLSKL